MSNTVRDVSDSGIEDMSLYVQKKQVAGKVPLTPGAVISGWFPRKIFVARVYRLQADVDGARYLSIYMLGKAKRTYFFLSGQAWRPST